MKKLLIVSILFILFCNCKSTQKTTITATKNAKENLIGVVNKASFNQAPYNIWFNQNYANYTPNASVLEKMKPHLKEVTIKGFMGTWCSDSKRETPKFYKMLEQIGFTSEKVTLIAVDKSKKTPSNLQKGFNVIKVPTFIFYKKGKEIGRFVEYPIETIEEDFLKIVSGQNYKHAYQN